MVGVRLPGRRVLLLESNWADETDAHSRTLPASNSRRSGAPNLECRPSASRVLMEPNERRRQIPPFVWLLVAVSICLWTAVLLVELARLESFDAYWFLVIPKVQGILSSGHLEIATYTPGWEAILSELVLVLGLPLDKLVFLPLGGFLLILPAYAFSRRIRMPPVSAILMTCFITLEVASIPVNYSVFADAWASPMLFLLLLS